MKKIFDPPPPAARLLDSTVHELVRDFPELLAVFRRSGIRLREDGASVLPPGFSRTVGDDGLTAALRWRSPRGP